MHPTYTQLVAAISQAIDTQVPSASQETYRSNIATELKPLSSKETVAGNLSLATMAGLVTSFTEKAQDFERRRSREYNAPQIKIFADQSEKNQRYADLVRKVIVSNKWAGAQELETAIQAGQARLHATPKSRATALEGRFSAEALQEHAVYKALVKKSDALEKNLSSQPHQVAAVWQERELCLIGMVKEQQEQRAARVIRSGKSALDPEALRHYMRKQLKNSNTEEATALASKLSPAARELLTDFIEDGSVMTLSRPVAIGLLSQMGVSSTELLKTGIFRAPQAPGALPSPSHESHGTGFTLSSLHSDEPKPGPRIGLATLIDTATPEGLNRIRAYERSAKRSSFDDAEPAPPLDALFRRAPKVRPPAVTEKAEPAPKAPPRAALPLATVPSSPVAEKPVSPPVSPPATQKLHAPTSVPSSANGVNDRSVAHVGSPEQKALFAEILPLLAGNGKDAAQEARLRPLLSRALPSERERNAASLASGMSPSRLQSFKNELVSHVSKDPVQRHALAAYLSRRLLDVGLPEDAFPTPSQDGPAGKEALFAEILPLLAVNHNNPKKEGQLRALLPIALPTVRDRIEASMACGMNPSRLNSFLYKKDIHAIASDPVQRHALAAYLSRRLLDAELSKETFFAAAGAGQAGQPVVSPPPAPADISRPLPPAPPSDTAIETAKPSMSNGHVPPVVTATETAPSKPAPPSDTATETTKPSHANGHVPLPAAAIGKAAPKPAPATDAAASWSHIIARCEAAGQRHTAQWLRAQPPVPKTLAVAEVMLRDAGLLAEDDKPATAAQAQLAADLAVIEAGHLQARGEWSDHSRPLPDRVIPIARSTPPAHAPFAYAGEADPRQWFERLPAGFSLAKHPTRPATYLVRPQAQVEEDYREAWRNVLATLAPIFSAHTHEEAHDPRWKEEPSHLQNDMLLTLPPKEFEARLNGFENGLRSDAEQAMLAERLSAIRKLHTEYWLPRAQQRQTEAEPQPEAFVEQLTRREAAAADPQRIPSPFSKR